MPLNDLLVIIILVKKEGGLSMNNKTLKMIHTTYILTIWSLICISLIVVYLVNTQVFADNNGKLFSLNNQKHLPSINTVSFSPMMNINFLK